jgi:hypothetical protein
MRLRDSTKTRVEPVFDELLVRDGTGAAWLPRLVALPSRQGAAAPTLPAIPLTRYGWGDSEISLAPPKHLLVWLVQNATLVDALAHQKTSPSTRAKRDLLLKRDAATIGEALARLSAEQVSDRRWYVLEGCTWPDVYLETERTVVVIEGKRTESAPTTCTTWMSMRHQMLRHLDCAWERRAGRDLFGFFIGEGEGGPSGVAVPPSWQAAAEDTVTANALSGSLPHRGEAERHAIAQCFLGATTWQSVCREFNIVWSELPDTV